MPDSNLGNRAVPPDASLTVLCAEQAQLGREIAALQAKFDKEREGLMARLTRVCDLIAIGTANIDLPKVQLAEQTLYLSGSYANGGDKRASVVRDAIDYFANNIKPPHCYYGLREGFYGTKHYDAWHGQRSDHAYGYGPKHGSIIFAVGIRDTKRDLTDEEREAVIYYLLNIERIEKAKAEAKIA